MFATPFRRVLALLAMLALLAVACGDDSGDDAEATDGDDVAVDDTTTTTTVPGTTAPPPEGSEAVVDVQLRAVEFGVDGYVEIVNNGADDADLNGIFLCQFPNYEDLGTLVEGGTLAAGATVQIPAAEWGGLDVATGEAALYNGNDFDSSDGILSYVQWGEGGHERASIAADAGLWPAADVFVTPDPSFNSIESGGFAADPENWS